MTRIVIFHHDFMYHVFTLSTFKLLKNIALFLYFIHINQENTENFILGPKPPGPNRERAETSWGRTGKGPKPLAFSESRVLRDAFCENMTKYKPVFH